MYVWSTDSLIRAFQLHMPEMYQLTEKLVDQSPSQFHSSLKAIYSKAESISIDYAISEKADNLILIPGDFGWDDVGNWDVVYNLGVQNDQGNVITQSDSTNKTLLVDSTNNLIHAGERLIALVGMNDFVVVDTDEIIMVAPKSRSQDVKKLVEKLKEQKRTEYL